MSERGICSLCGHEKELRESHIIPKFVSSWIKRTSATGFMRLTPNINVRAQDGFKQYMLCQDCESLFSNWETSVANNIFHPHNRREDKEFSYGQWLLKFAVSVSWRSLTHYIENSKQQIGYKDADLLLFEKALVTWKDFIFDLRPHPGRFEQHMILVDTIESASNPESLESNMNRYLTRSLEINLAYSADKPSFIYTKMAKIILLGFLDIQNLKDWKDTKIHVKHGRIGGDITIPSNLIEYLNERAGVAKKYQNMISDKQREVIDSSYRKDIDSVPNSESFKAIDADVRLFGKEAVFKRNSSE